MIFNFYYVMNIMISWFHQRCQEWGEWKKRKWRETNILQVGRMKKGWWLVGEVHGKYGIKIGQGAPRAQCPSGGPRWMMCWGPNLSMILGRSNQEWLLPGTPFPRMMLMPKAMRFVSSLKSFPFLLS